MKSLCLLTTFLLFSTFAIAQEPFVNVGAGLPMFFKSDFAEGGSIHQLSRKRVHLFAEVPIQIGKAEIFSVHPGVGYFLFNEIEQNDPSALGGYSNKELQHNAISIYTRMFYHLESKNKSFRQYYFGGTFGAYLWSKTTGESSWWIYTRPPASGSTIYNESGKIFFHSVYLGLTAGAKFRTKDISKIQSAIELSFFPLFVTVDDAKRPMAMLTVVLGTGQKKATRINE
ncbi:MAG: hypothetical protein AB7S72_03215 [Draconibacterium sp.]